jgi:hypothetical protein
LETTKELGKMTESSLVGTSYRTIGIRGTGPGSGKDTAAEMLAHMLRERGIRSSIQKFATPIREMLEEITGVPVAVSETVEGKNLEVTFNSERITVGRALQLLGSSMKKSSNDPNYWINALFKRFKPEELVIISDVRFPLEQQAVKERRGITLMIDRLKPIDPTSLAQRDLNHESERSLDNTLPDATIENTGSITELKEKLNSFIDTILLLESPL